EFEERAATALRSSDVGDGEAALALYADDLLADDLYEEWTATRRESLRLAWVRLVHFVAERHLADRRFDRAAEPFERAVAADASDEAAHRGAMRAHARAGRRHLARRQFAECEAVLRREVDAAPSAETIALRAAIEAGRLDPPPVAEPKPAPAPRPAAPAPVA